MPICVFGCSVLPFRLHLSRIFACIFGAAVVLHGADAGAVAFDVSIGTGVLSGTPATLEIDLLAGDNTDGNNTANLTLFATDGALGAAASTGNVTGSLPGAVSMDESLGLGQVLQDITLGNSITFRVDLTTNFAGGLDFDRFDVFLLDPATSFSLVDTDIDPGDALLRILLVGAPGGVTTFVSGGTRPNNPTVTVTLSPVQAVPEPGAASLLLLGLPALWWEAMRHRRP